MSLCGDGLIDDEAEGENTITERCPSVKACRVCDAVPTRRGTVGYRNGVINGDESCDDGTWVTDLTEMVSKSVVYDEAVGSSRTPPSAAMRS